MSVGAYRLTIAGQEMDIGNVPVPLTITHGRSSAATQPDAPDCQFSWLHIDPPGAIGDTVVVSASLLDSGLTWIYDAPNNYMYDSPDYVWDNAWTLDVGPRFVGRMSGLAAREVDGRIVEWAVRCVGEQGTIARLDVLADRPAETDVARVQAIAAAAGFPITIDGTPGLTLAADTLDRGSALDAIQEICESSGGLVWQDKAGRMHYGTADHRQADPTWTLSAGAIVDGLQWRSDIESLINHITLRWGPEGAQSEHTISEAGSMAMPWGKRHVDVTTLAATQADADQLGALILARRAWPFWLMDTVMADGRHADRPDTITLTHIDVGTIILIPAPTEPDTTPSEWTAWVVEGWTETATESGAELQLSVSDAARWGQTRLRTWQEARGYTWAQEAAGTWLDALIWEAA